MYEPAFNSVLVEINDEDAKYGSGNDESMLGKSYSKGTFISMGLVMTTQAYPMSTEQESGVADVIGEFEGKSIIWNEGAEAGTTFDVGEKKYGFIYWYDIRGVAE